MGAMQTTPPPVGRLDRIDQLRAVAMLWMTAFHFCFDLNHFGFIQENFYRDPFWTLQRTAIVSLFLFTAGLSQAMASANGQDWSRFWRRWLQIAAAALLVSAGSWLMFPRSFIYFGVLHGVAVMLVVARLTVGWGGWLWPLGAVAVSAPWWAPLIHQHWADLAFLNSPGWNALGLISRKPVTEDYVPVLPWLGAVWWGVAAGQWLLKQGAEGFLLRPPSIGWTGRSMATLGRWSLSYYLLHQPIMIGLLAGVVWVMR